MRKAAAYDINGNVTDDATNSLQTSYNLLNFPAQTKSGTTVKANYSYLSDGTKASVLNASGAGYDYNGTFTYSHASGGTRTLESVAFGGGRIRKNGSTYAVDYYVTDHLGSVRAIVNASGTIVEQNDFYPFGTRQQNGLTTLSANRWRFSGKEGYDSAFGIALDDFGARRYDRTAWTSIDPLAEKYYNVSPYAYCAGNPVRFVDPEGTNPIYSIYGELLGTDDNGLQGEAIIMERQNFSQGMRPEDALRFNLGKNALVDDDAVAVFNDSFNNLSLRPDWDGVVTKQEADTWWLQGTGEPLYVNRSKIELPGISIESFHKNKSFYKNFVWGLSETGKTFGTLRLQISNDEEILIGNEYQLDEYDFKMQKGRPLRNIATLVGRPGKKSEGQDFKFYGYGKKTISK